MASIAKFTINKMDSIDVQDIDTFIALDTLDESAPSSESLLATSSFQGITMPGQYCYRHRVDSPSQALANDDFMARAQSELETLPSDIQIALNSTWSLFANAPDRLRRTILDGILAKCCFPQLSYISAAIKTLVRIDFLTVLPSELSLRILQYLDASSLCKAAQVSHSWRNLADSDAVWWRICEQHIDKRCSGCGWGLPLLSRDPAQTMRQHHPSLGGSQGQSKRKLAPQLEVDSDTKDPLPLRPTKRQRTENDCPSLDEACCFPQTRPWKDVYKERFMIGLNWNHGRFRTRMFEGHTDSIMCLQFDAAILATGSYDATIKLWDLETGKLRRTLVGHAAGVRALQFDSAKLISGSLDHTIKIWNHRTGECIRTLVGHDDGIIGLHFIGNVIASGSKDKTIKIWNFDDKESFTLRGHKDDVNSVQLDLHSRTLLSASDDFTLRLWDLTTRQCIKTFEGHCGQVQQVSFLPPHFETALSRSDAEMISDPAVCTGTSTPSARSALAGDFLANPDRVLPPQYAVSAGLDNTLRLWDISSGKCVRVFYGHTDGVWALAADNLRIVSGAGDTQVKVWDFTKTECTRTIPGHREPVTCVFLSDAMFCTGSDDGRARLFDFRPEAKF